MDNAYKGKKIEFHILQSFPVTCLNRDDVGAPKTAVVGGVTRARVSSQCWKRQVRLAMREFGVKTAVRTKHVAEMILKECVGLEANEETAKSSAESAAAVLVKDTLHFFCKEEARAIAEYLKEKNWVGNDKEIIKVHKDGFKKAMANANGLDIALFGRMVAQAATLNVEAASHFSHALSTHKAANEVEFFTALDDAKPEDSEDAGSSHMGSLEFNSATYYRYVGLDLGQLVETMGGDEHLDKALEAFVKALYLAVPSARQTTQSGSNPWDYARVYVRKGQNMQLSFDKPVKAKGEGFLKPSIEEMNTLLEKREKLSGSLFQKIEDFTWGEDDSFTIDDLISGIQSAVRVS